MSGEPNGAGTEGAKTHSPSPIIIVSAFHRTSCIRIRVEITRSQSKEWVLLVILLLVQELRLSRSLHAVSHDELLGAVKGAVDQLEPLLFAGEVPRQKVRASLLVVLEDFALFEGLHDQFAAEEFALFVQPDHRDPHHAVIQLQRRLSRTTIL